MHEDVHRDDSGQGCGEDERHDRADLGPADEARGAGREGATTDSRANDQAEFVNVKVGDVARPLTREPVA